MSVVLLYSGGLDSTVLLYDLLAAGQRVRCLSVLYGQKHQRREMVAAELVCRHLHLKRHVVDLSGLTPLFATSSLVSSDPVPEGHYADESMRSTVVPNRNALLLMTAAAYAIREGADAVAYACHRGDHAIYPDCRPQFVESVRSVLRTCHFTPIDLLTPFLDRDKGQIVRLGYSYGVPFEMTWSCYKGRYRHCGKCGTCVERREAFEQADVFDPTEYRA